MTIPTFHSQRDRDAWSTIRGFVYQVELILEQWGEIQEPYVIELEFGEDIDIIRQALADEEPDMSRCLQQIKHSDRSVTLRKDSVTEFLASAVEHRRANPGLQLSFRYITNADPGIERPTTFSPRAPAITRWKILSQAADIAGHADTGRIAEILKSAKMPRDLNPDTWRTYREFLDHSSPTEVADLIKSVTWSTEVGDVDDVKDRVYTALEIIHSVDTQDVPIVHSHLFQFVFMLLSRKGPKRLSRHDFVQQVKISSEMADTAMHSRVEEILETLETRLDKMESALKSQRPILELVTRGMGLPYSLNPTSPSLNFDPPPTPDIYIKRPNLSMEIERACQPGSVIALVAPHGVGKTQLARECLASHSYTWLRLGGRSPDECTWLLSQAAYAADLRGHSLLVLDGVGSFSAGDGFFDDVENLAKVFCLVVTSSYSLPARVRINLGDRLHEYGVPLLAPEEIGQLLDRLEAPNGLLTDKSAEFFFRITKGHPQLVHALARYLRLQEWSLAEADLSALFSGTYANETLQDVQHLVVQTVQDSDARDLLYRLGLVIGDIDNHDVQTVSTVAPSISRPGEKLSVLIGPWAQRDSDLTIALSPLVVHLARGNIETAQIKAISQALANSILSAPVLDEANAVKAILYLTNAENHDVAAAVYVSCALDMPVEHIRSARSLLPSIWMGTPLDPAMSMNCKVLVRAAQIRIAFYRELGAEYIVKEIEAHLGNGFERESFSINSAVAAIVAATTAGTFASKLAGAHTQRLLRRAIGLLGHPSVRDMTHFADVATGLFRAVCISGSAVGSIDELFDWLTTMALVPVDECPDGELSLYTQAIFAVTNIVFTEDLEKTRREAHEMSERLGHFPFDHKASRLFASCIYCVRMQLEAEAQNVDAVHTLYAEGSRAVSGQGRAEFYLSYEYAHQLWMRLYFHPSEARWLTPVLERLVATPLTGEPARTLKSYLMMSAIYRGQKPTRAADLLETAEIFANSHADVERIDLAVVLGEKGIAVCDAEGIASGFALWDSVMDLIVDLESVGVREKKISVAVGHCIGYYTGLALGVKEARLSGGGEYVKPMPGLFLRIVDAAASEYRAERLATLAANMWQFAEVIKDDASAEKWSRKVLVLLEKHGVCPERAFLARAVLPLLLVDGAFSLAIEWSYESVSAMMKSAEADDVEAISMHAVMVPVILRLLTLRMLADSAAATAVEEVCNACASRFLDSGYHGWRLSGRIVESLRSLEIARGEAESILSESQGLGAGHITAQAMLVSSFGEGASLVDALGYHLRSLHFISSTATRLVHDKIVVPFLDLYWRRCIERGRFRFVAPTLVEEGLAEATGMRGEEATRAILASLLVGVPLRVPADIRSWLRGT